MKYEFTGETKGFDGHILRRVRYPETGELGGWIESEANLSQEGTARVCGEAQVRGEAWVYGKAQVRGEAQISGKAQVSGGAWDESPLQIQGTRFFVSVSSHNSLAVGCTTKTAAQWLESCETEFAKHMFTEQERLEYKLYFNLAATLYGWDVPRFPA